MGVLCNLQVCGVCFEWKERRDADSSIQSNSIKQSSMTQNKESTKMCFRQIRSGCSVAGSWGSWGRQPSACRCQPLVGLFGLTKRQVGSCDSTLARWYIILIRMYGIMEYLREAPGWSSIDSLSSHRTPQNRPDMRHAATGNAPQGAVLRDMRRSFQVQQLEITSNKRDQ